MPEAKISIEAIKKLRETTGVGLSDAQGALTEADGDIVKAQEILRKKGIAKAAKKATRSAKQGLVDCYIHGGKVGVLVEVNCETDFVAKTDDFKNLVHDIALQIAGAAPKYVSREQVPQSIIDHERGIAEEQMAGQNKPKDVLERIIAGKLDKFFEEMCLLEQPTIKDPKMKVGTLVTDAVAKLGENIVVSRFARYVLGEEQLS